MLFVDPAMARRLEQHEAEATADYTRTMAALQPDSGACLQPVAGGYAVFTSPRFPINRAVGLGVAGPVTAADMDMVEDFYRRHDLPAQVDLYPLADSSLLDLLGHRGYRILRFLNALVRPITPADARPAPVAGVSVSTVPPADAERWALTIARGFSGQDEVPADDVSLAIARVALRRPGVTCFLATVDGEPAGAAALSVRDGLATLFSTSTRPAFRRRGVQAALIQARLATAATAGCDLATVSTPSGGASQRNVQRAGFAVAYTRLSLVEE